VGLQPAARQVVLRGPRPHLHILYVLYKLLSNLGGYVYQLLLLFHVRPANQPTVPGVALCNKKVVDPWARTFFCDVCVWVKRNFIAEWCN